MRNREARPRYNAATLNPSPDRFLQQPCRTVLSLSVPVFFALIAEPLTGLVDTFFVSRLGSPAQAGLGIGTILLSSVFWVFNFLAIGTQTEIARALGAGAREEAAEVHGVALGLGAFLGVLLAGLIWPALPTLCEWMGARGEAHDSAVTYVRIRLIGAPASLLMQVAFGALRGLQHMRVLVVVSVLVHGLNILLDSLLILGRGPLPRLGIEGAAWASTGALWLGAFVAVSVSSRRLGWPRQFSLHRALGLFVVGRDLILRTGMLMLFLTLATERATTLGDDAAAAHQAIRQVWLFTALVLDAVATTAQSLVGYFLGAGRPGTARVVARTTCAMGVLAGAALTGLMLAATVPVRNALVPASATGWFLAPWIACALAQPINAISFVTDGIHWATRDYRYLRNAMLAATGLGILGLFLVDESSAGGLTLLWIVTGVWISVRALLGMLRVWPGIGASPWVRPPDDSGTPGMDNPRSHTSE